MNRIFRLNSCDWYAGPDFESAAAQAALDLGYPVDAVIDDQFSTPDPVDVIEYTDINGKVQRIQSAQILQRVREPGLAFSIAQ